MTNNFKICLLGYTSEYGNTCWYPWNRFNETFRSLGYDTQWCSLNHFSPNVVPTLFVVWNQPDAVDLVNSPFYVKGRDIIIQKVVGGSPRFNTPPYGESVEEANKFFYNHDFPDYKMCLDLISQGHNLYVFGAKTSNENTPIKKKICDSLGDRLFMIPWGTCLYSLEEIKRAEPIMSDFDYDIGFIGSFWGNSKIGSLNNVDKYLKPLFPFARKNKIRLAGSGTGYKRIGNHEHSLILKKSAICPIVNSDSWKSLRGVQDRFWTVFASGRFGVCDTEGVYEFFDEKEVIVETDPLEYVSKSIYFLRNIYKQKPYIESVLSRIKKEYNYYNTWSRILNKIEKDI
jgi:hypothetical protein